MQDDDAWKKYPKYHKWFDKLWLSEQLGYECGPCGVAPTRTGRYVVRPIYNLSGMGVGAQIKTIEPGDTTQVPPGYFWCEVFEGQHYSATYEYVEGQVPYWRPLSCWVGENDESDLSRFHRWTRSKYVPEVPRLFNELSAIRRINVEFRGDHPIEVHLRDTPDPDYDEIIPVWADDQEKLDKLAQEGYSYRKDYDDADGFLSVPRVGFLVRNHRPGE